MEQNSKPVIVILDDDLHTASARLSVDALRQDLLEAPRDEVIDKAFEFQNSYRDLLDRGFRQQGRIASSFFKEMLEDAYPDAEPSERRALASEIENLIHAKLGLPPHSITNEQVAEADAKARTAQEILAASLTPDEVNSLESIARKRIPTDRWPNNFDDFKEEWLAGWIAKGILALPE
jgi:hypothetical protein